MDHGIVSFTRNCHIDHGSSSLAGHDRHLSVTHHFQALPYVFQGDILSALVGWI